MAGFLTAYCADEEWTDAFHIILECIFFNLSISVAACAICILVLAGAGVTTHLQRCRETTESARSFRPSEHESQHAGGLSARWRNRWTHGIPGISSETFLLIHGWHKCWPRPCSVVARGSFLRLKVHDVRTWATTGCLCLCVWAFFRLTESSLAVRWRRTKQKQTLCIGVFCFDGRGQPLPSWESSPWILLKAYARSEQPTWRRINPVRKLTSKRTSLLWHWQSHDKTVTVAKGPHTRVHSKASRSKKLNVCDRSC